MSPFNPQNDIPSLSGKVILITGGTSGLGAGSVLELARHSPTQIFFTGRNEKSADDLISRAKKENPNVRLTFIRNDISSFESVRAAAQTFTDHASRLDILMLNAGVMAVKPIVSADGYETQFATNHLGHAYLVHQLLPTLLTTAAQPNADVRIINMSSTAHSIAPSQGIDFATLKTAQPHLGSLLPGSRWARYGQSKLAQVLYSQQLAQRYPQLTSVAVHPGVVFTGLWDGVPFLTKLPALMLSIGNTVPVDQGHYNQVWAATSDKTKLRNGGYYEPMGLLKEPKIQGGRNGKLAEELWTWTQAQFEA